MRLQLDYPENPCPQIWGPQIFKNHLFYSVLWGSLPKFGALTWLNNAVRALPFLRFNPVRVILGGECREWSHPVIAALNYFIRSAASGLSAKMNFVLPQQDELCFATAQAVHACQDVLCECADWLDMDPHEVCRGGRLVCGTEELRDLTDLEEGQMHEVTLVLSWRGKGQLTRHHRESHVRPIGRFS